MKELENRKVKKKKIDNYHQEEKTFTTADILALFELAQEKKLILFGKCNKNLKKS